MVLLVLMSWSVSFGDVFTAAVNLPKGVNCCFLRRRFDGREHKLNSLIPRWLSECYHGRPEVGGCSRTDRLSVRAFFESLQKCHVCASFLGQIEQFHASSFWLEKQRVLCSLCCFNVITRASHWFNNFLNILPCRSQCIG